MNPDRRGLSIKEFMAFATILVNICALVWGAAKISATVDDLKTTVIELHHTTERMAQDIAAIKIDYNARIEVLESKLNVQSREAP